MTTAESRRLAEDPTAWKKWGPYLAERAWGTVREDYSANGDAWNYFPHHQSRSRTYRWSEDGLGGICDSQQLLCVAFAFWNERDPFLKERIFGLTNGEGNHGEDAKEYWWYLDSTPTHSYMRWRYLYSQDEFPYAQLVEINRRRGRDAPEYELVDTGLLDEGYWDITIEYAKESPDDILMLLTVRNTSSQPAMLHVLPTMWFRNTWSWKADSTRPRLSLQAGAIVADHDHLGRYTLSSEGASAPALFCDNESNTLRLWKTPGHRYPKDGINDYVVNGQATINPQQTGTKAAFWHRMTVPGQDRREIRLRLRAEGTTAPPEFERTLVQRRNEADAFYASLTPADATDDEAQVMRQAFAGLLWSKQFYHYNVEVWLDGDSGQPLPPADRNAGRNSEWRHLNNADIISMPDKWEFPWYASWDLAFGCVALAHVDAEFAKSQLLLLCREWFMHPNGQLPAYEWAFGDVNPPVHAWAALRVFEIAGSADYEFLERILHKLLLNFTWWVNRKDVAGNNVFEGGFLGLDNIGPIDRSAQLPVGEHLEQADGTAWMAMYCLNLLEMALVLADHDFAYEDIATKFFEHFAYIATAINEQGLWNEQDGFYYDVLLVDNERIPLQGYSMVGLIPLFATTTLGKATLARLENFALRFHWFLDNKPQYADVVGHVNRLGMHEGRLLSIVSPDRLRRILEPMLDGDAFLSPYGLRSVSRVHAERPFTLSYRGSTFEFDYEPAESTSGLFGGNSNWRGPVWFPVNYLVIESLRRFARYLGDDFEVELPTRSRSFSTITEVADELARRLVAIFLRDQSGRRPVLGWYDGFQRDPELSQMIPFHEYFHGDTGMGLGASHQTGWTGLVADLISSRSRR